MIRYDKIGCNLLPLAIVIIGMKNPFTRAASAALYIACVVLAINRITSFAGQNETLFIPMAMLSLFVLSAAVMGFLFVSEPLLL
ncbi:hypothetical protein KW799_01075, partial [Candidatus Parcubacteria bacterium]|nr:hypothetical protein [Candidatus Parcubacteria bacterium]